MRVLLNIQNAMFNKVQELVEKGGYDTVSDFFIAAGENQLLLEQMPEGRSLENGAIGQMLHKTESLPKADLKELSIPIKASIVTVEPPVDEQLLYKDMTKDEAFFLSGQMNRILPMKVGLRVLSNMLSDKEECYIPLSTFVKKATSVAQRFRELLVRETMHITGKKDSVWAGLPEPGSDVSCNRYKNQFLAHLRKDGIIEGGLGRLRFVNLTHKDNGKVHIGITEPGLDFSIIENPVIDHRDCSGMALSEREIMYYIFQIKMYAQGEYKAFKDILYLIYKGISRTNDLNIELAKKWPKNWSKAMVNTQRNGAVSRLAEIGFLKKIKMGKEVEFQLTDKGKEFLND